MEPEEEEFNRFAQCAGCGLDIGIDDDDEWYSAVVAEDDILDAYNGGSERAFWCGGEMGTPHVPGTPTSLEDVEAEMKAKLLTLRAALGGAR